MADSISLEETNALRAKLGLPPLAGDAEEQIDPDQEAYENYQKRKDEEEKQRKAEEIRRNIEKSKNRRKQLEKLPGRGLGEADQDDDSALKWIQKLRKREKQLAEQRAREQAEMDAGFVENYEAKDLAGLKVGHDLTEFNEGSEVILTLKDRGILDEDDENAADELTNIQIEERERLRENLENKKKKPAYNPYDDEEFMLGGGKKSVLPDYEEKAKKEGFTIGKSGQVVNPEEEQSVSDKLKAHTLSYEKMKEIKDYYTQDEAALSFKKPKKKKKKDKIRKRAADDDDIPTTTATTTTTTTTVTSSSSPAQGDTNGEGEPKEPSVRKNLDTDANFVDDDDLQLALSKARRAANKQRAREIKKLTPEQIAQRIAEEREQEGNQEGSQEGEGLVLSEMSEFVSNLGSQPTYTSREASMSRRAASAEKPSASPSPTPEEAVADSQETPIDEAPIEAMETEGESTTPAPEDQDQKQAEAAIIEEPLVSGGLAATLSLLSQKGVVAKPTEEQLKRDRQAAQRLKWAAEQKKRDLERAAREREREQNRRRGRHAERDTGNRGRDRELQREREREREREKELEEREAMRAFEERMKNYRPDVKLEYVDEEGRQLDTKEAFRYMSHKFHGKTSGKAKTEKRMQKMEEELKLNMMSSSDTPLNLATRMLERQQKTGNAHVVLSVGNRGVVAPGPAGVVAESSKAGSKRSREGSDDEGTSSISKKKR
ncbi:SART-1 protein [Syncephalastrum racemosum]|uniref:SART-1 protein n=1 Tax=Syncephalastrum racemosum TaxID=13706 RepID=A0A1X2HUV7_SYNRA|nr:SART-1 protein [Syncephalastrum racemosum]